MPPACRNPTQDDGEGMKRLYSGCALACAGVFGAKAAFAHAVCGARVFPVPLTMDDPGVADEASIPTFTYDVSGSDEGPGRTREYNLNFEYDKRITTNLGLAINYGWNIQTPYKSETQAGFQNLFVTAKYQTCVSPDHEFIFTVGVQREFGGTGTLRAGADEFGSTAPTLYLGKGLGDVPVPWLRPFAIEGELSYSIADKGLKGTPMTDPDTGLTTIQYNHGSSNQWFGGISLLYSLQYLQSQVKDVGLPEFIGRLTPIVEITWTSPASSPTTSAITWQIAPGLLYSGDWYQIGVEALIPLNSATGTNVGVIAQFHMFLDDLFPNTLGKPIVDWFR
jgi:hypothetical protein